MTARTFTVRGIKMRTSSNRRFVVVVARAEDVVVDAERVVATRTFSRVSDRQICSASITERRAERYVAFSTIVARSDSVETARRRARQHGAGPGSFVAVVDTTTGEEV